MMPRPACRIYLMNGSYYDVSDSYDTVVNEWHEALEKADSFIATRSFSDFNNRKKVEIRMDQISHVLQLGY